MPAKTNGANLSKGQVASLACILEVSAPKPGNVHRSADFEDLTLTDFLTSAIAIGPILDRHESLPVGELILECIRATRQLVRTNTNLGLVLLLAPLCKADGQLDRHSVGCVLEQLNADDAASVYQAIRIANPGGMGRAEQHDINETPPGDLMEAMRLAADHDSIANQYCNQFRDVFDLVVPELAACHQETGNLTEAIVYTHVSLMSQIPDSLIARKCGADEASRASAMAVRTIQAGRIGSAEYLSALDDLDFWLRADGHRRNPGTTADLIGAGLFVAIWNDKIEFPIR